MRARLGEWWITLSVSISGTLIMLVALELCARAYYGVRPVSIVDERVRDLASRQGFAEQYGARELAQFWKDTQTCPLGVRWGTYVHYRWHDCRSETVNVVKGRRVTPNASGDARTTVFVFGGSTIFGTGVTDAHTIPSFVQSELTSRGIERLRVVNFGTPGYVSFQEVIQLEKELSIGNVPDVVVFYDGANDFYASLYNGTAGLVQNDDEFRKKFEGERPGYISLLQEDSGLVRATFNLVDKLKGSRRDEEKWRSETEARAGETATTYLNHLKMANALAKAYGFKIFFFLQPTAFTKKTLTSFEVDAIANDRIERVSARRIADRLQAFNLETYRRIESAVGKPATFTNLSTLFDDKNETIFYDAVHVNETGNLVIAKKIADVIAPSVPRR